MFQNIPNLQKNNNNVTIVSDNVTKIEVDLNEIETSKQELNKFISNYQSLIQYCITIGQNSNSQFDEPYLKQKFKRDKELLECFKEVSSQIKSLNLFFEGLNVKINLNKESFVKITIYDDNQLDQAQKPHNQNDFMINLYCEAKDLYKKKKKIEAYEKFSEVLRINPSFVEARIYRGNLSLDVNNLSYAQFDFEEVLKQDKQNLKALKGITIALKMQCNYELGLKYALKILKHEPNSSQGNFNAADCLKFLGQYNDNILNYINQAIDQEKRRSDQKLQVYYRNKGEILFGLGREVEAREFVQKALLINQNYELALKTQKRFDEFTQNRVPT